MVLWRSWPRPLESSYLILLQSCWCGSIVPQVGSFGCMDYVWSSTSVHQVCYIDNNACLDSGIRGAPSGLAG
eukprot:3038321-Amphidinium_carterae.1